MNLQDLFSDNISLQTKKLFTAVEVVTAIQLTEGAELKEHNTKVPALLVCVVGEVVFENEKGVSEKMLTGDFINIEPRVKHWVKSVADSRLLLIK